MKKPPPGMKSMPVKPGETKSQYMDRVRATKPTGTTGPGRVAKDPGTGAPKPRVGVGGGVKGPFSKASASQRGGPLGMKSGGMVKGKK